MELGSSHFCIGLAEMKNAVKWIIEVTKLIIEIIGIRVALFAVSVCGGFLYALDCLILIPILLLVEIVNATIKIVTVSVTACETIVLFPSFITRYVSNMKSKEDIDTTCAEDDNIEPIRCCVSDLLHQVEKMIANEVVNRRLIFEEITELPQKMPDREALRSHIRRIIKEAYELFEEDMKNIQFLIHINEEFLDGQAFNTKEHSPLKIENGDMPENEGEMELQKLEKLLEGLKLFYRQKASLMS